MGEKPVELNLGAIQSTLLIPLWARAVETEKEDPIVCDHYAKEILSKIDYDFSTMASGQTGEHQIIWAIRAASFDKIVQEFLNTNNDAVIINIGSGLDTTSKRVSDRRALWINIEMPDVASLRQKLIPDTEREITIPRSVFDFSWIKDISHLTADRPVLFMASGVLFYFDAGENEILLKKLSNHYPSAHFVFDAISSVFWLKVTNWTIMKKGGMDRTALLKWHLRKTKKLREWVDTIQVIEEYPLMGQVEPHKDWDKKFKRDFKIAKILRMLGLYRMVHIKL
ncbi:class I SAM-dependent methyltransferase [Acidobacteriota bacterium]